MKSFGCVFWYFVSVSAEIIRMIEMLQIRFFNIKFSRRAYLVNSMNA